MRKIYVLCVLVIICFSAKSQLAQWTFETVVTTNTGIAPIFTTGTSAADAGTQTAGSFCSGLHASSSTVWSNPAGNGSAKSISSNNWAVGDYFQFQFNTTGFMDISITWDAAGSNTGPADFKVQYSTDGTSFTDAIGTNSTYSLATGITWNFSTYEPASTRTLDLSTITSLNNKPTVYIRLVVTTTTAITGGTVATTGTSRVDNFIVNANPIGAPSTDFFRSITSGNWNAIATWESSPTGAAGTWVTATATPTSAANTIQIRSGHTVTLTASASADQLQIENGAVLDYTAGTFTIDDGTGADVDILNGGVFVLSQASTIPTFTGGTASVNIATGGTLRISASGLTGAGTGVNATNFVYQHQSILEYTLTGGFSTGAVVYFPNVDAVTVPIFKTTADAPTVMNVGASTTTTFNGVFEAGGTAIIRWRNGGNKIFRNGIRGQGSVDFDASTIASAKFIINGTTAELGGTGSLIVPATGGLEIGTPTLVTMSSNKTVTGNIALLTKSQINLGDFDLTVTGTISNATVTSYVRTNGTGKLTLNNISSGAGGKLFPIGLSSINPLFIQSTATANFSARVVEPITPAIYNDDFSVLRTWNISSSVTSPGATISYGYSYPGDCGALFINTGPSIQVGVNVNSVWNILQSGLIASPFPLVPGTFIVTPAVSINTFTSNGTEYPFVVANNGAVLPLDNIIIATAQKINTSGRISWKVFNTENISRFEVQRSTGNGSFQTFGTVDFSSQSFNYEFNDAVLPAGSNQYRIKVIRLNGAISYSNTVTINNNSKGLLITSIAPNPVQDKTTLTISATRPGTVLFQVYNMNGVVVKTWNSFLTEGNTVTLVDMSNLSSGVYYIAAFADEGKTVFRMAKY